MKRPLSITIIAILFIAIGALAPFRDGWKLLESSSLRHGPGITPHDWRDFGYAFSTHFLALIGGIALFRGMGWSRWLLLAWMLFHVILSFWHNPLEVALHAAMLALLAFFFFSRRAAAYFGRGTGIPAGGFGPSSLAR